MLRRSFFSNEAGYLFPVIIFLSGSKPIDDWRGALDEIRDHNPWFRNSTKICMALGDNANEEVLAQIAKRPDGEPNSKAVIKISNTAALTKLISVVSATVSMIGPAFTIDNNIQKSILSEVKRILKGETDIEIKDQTSNQHDMNTARDSYTLQSIGQKTGGWDDDWDYDDDWDVIDWSTW